MPRPPTRQQLEERVEQELEAQLRQRQADDDAELRASEAKYRALFESAQDAILLVDESGRMITDCNGRAVSLTGRQREELIGTLVEEVIHDGQVAHQKDEAII